MAETFETRVYLRKQCLLSEASILPPPQAAPGPEILGALAGIFLPLLIGKVIGGVSAALKKAGSEKTSKAAGRLPTYLYQLPNKAGGKVELNPDLGCVIIVRGQFSKADDDKIPPITFTTPGVFLAEEDEAQRIRRLNDNGIPVVALAAIYEARIVVADDGTAIRYESRFLQVNEFQDSGNKRSMVVSVAISGAGEKEGEPVLSLGMMNFGEMKRGTIMGPDQVKSRRGAWLGGLGITENSMNVVKGLTLPATNRPNPIGVMPVTVEGVFAETEKANDALLFIAEVLDAKKDDVAKTLSDEILKDRGKEKAEAADAVEKLRQDEEKAYGEYLDAKVDLAKLGPPPAQPDQIQAAERRAKEFALETKKRAWRAKYDAVRRFGVELTRAE